MGIGYCLGYINRLLLDVSLKGIEKLVSLKKDKKHADEPSLENKKIDASFVVKSGLNTTKEHDFLIEDSNNVTFKDIAGIDNALEDLAEIVDFLKQPKKYITMGASLPRGVLLEGPPGNGKTLIARALAHEAGCTFIQINGSEFVEKYVGVGASRVRELFEQARNHKPAIIFIDEIDALGSVNRGSNGNEEYKQTLNEVLCQMDGFKHDGALVVIAATNHAKSLDAALVRSGRFDRKISISLPNGVAREKIIRLYLSKLPQQHCDVSDECISKVVKGSYGMSGADLKNMVNEAVLAAIKEEKDKTSDEHMLRALDKMKDKTK